MSVASEFKAFIARGNVLDLAVGVIIGAAFGKIVSSLTEDVIMPLVGLVTGNVDFTNKFVVLGAVPATYKGALTDYAALKAAGVPMLGYGAFTTAVINFLLMAFVIFLLVRQVGKLTAQPEVAAPPPPPAGPSEVDLLTEIRDALKSRG
ncbi:large conductance mechanosensitive channel protein MscL [Novosphingobium sp. FKTRR1]|uniref:large conductance mechanosensitive channel protein MscL n=1 Tax=unclassified Novosphingobium TaxID=2644732 RepID=UPI001CF01FF7|nr:large conductance mechanosensitive channel protein MscL [Novosphingobium sp. FKTRR1]